MKHFWISVLISNIVDQFNLFAIHNPPQPHKYPWYVFLQISPLLDGSFTITAHDLCLLPTTSAPVSNIHISGVSGIIVKVVDKVRWRLWGRGVRYRLYEGVIVGGN